MSLLPTPHIAANAGDFAETVIMPGDPLRAKMIAETFLENTTCINTVRNMLAFTGFYKNKKVSVMGSGMGMPSMGIYSYELYNFYNVETIIRIGTAGAVAKNLQLRDIVVGLGACTDSNYAAQYKLPGTFAPTASFELLCKVHKAAKENHLNLAVGNILSSDAFYSDNDNALEKWRKMGVLAVEMETAALYMNAARAAKKALCILTISDYTYQSGALTANERQESLKDMVTLALEAAL